LYPWRNGQHSGRLRCTVLMGLTQVANVAGFGFEAHCARRENNKDPIPR
jgi:hypothetical protein